MWPLVPATTSSHRSWGKHLGWYTATNRNHHTFILVKLGRFQLTAVFSSILWYQRFSVRQNTKCGLFYSNQSVMKCREVEMNESCCKNSRVQAVVAEVRLPGDGSQQEMVQDIVIQPQHNTAPHQLQLQQTLIMRNQLAVFVPSC